MTQNRTWDYGGTFTSDRANSVQYALHAPGVYRGFDISVVDTDKIEVSSGYLLLPSGIVLNEVNPFQLTLAVAPVSAKTYTITVRHTDADVAGGQAAEYDLETGELTDADITDGLALGWIRHPGGGVALDSDFIFEARKVLQEVEDQPHLRPQILLAPFTYRWVESSTGANTSVSDGLTAPSTVFTRVETDGLGPAPPLFETTVRVLPLASGNFAPYTIVVRAQIASNSEVDVVLYDTDGTSVTLTDATLAPSTVLSDYEISVDATTGVFTPGDPYALEFTFKTPALDSVDIQSVTINFDPLP